MASCGWSVAQRYEDGQGRQGEGCLQAQVQGPVAGNPALPVRSALVLDQLIAPDDHQGRLQDGDQYQGRAHAGRLPTSARADTWVASCTADRPLGGRP